mmetsp:Transcript_6735/g.26032  ORF Transcript_6735/g.26032 Transcript_6735/m.26032 type:complete len:225 (-) Transcript_6735:706-1380(-)
MRAWLRLRQASPLLGRVLPGGGRARAGQAALRAQSGEDCSLGVRAADSAPPGDGGWAARGPQRHAPAGRLGLLHQVPAEHGGHRVGLCCPHRRGVSLGPPRVPLLRRAARGRPEPPDEALHRGDAAPELHRIAQPDAPPEATGQSGLRHRRATCCECCGGREERHGQADRGACASDSRGNQLRQRPHLRGRRREDTGRELGRRSGIPAVEGQVPRRSIARCQRR